MVGQCPAGTDQNCQPPTLAKIIFAAKTLWLKKASADFSLNVCLVPRSYIKVRGKFKYSSLTTQKLGLGSGLVCWCGTIVCPKIRHSCRSITSLRISEDETSGKTRLNLFIACSDSCFMILILTCDSFRRVWSDLNFTAL